MSLYTRTGDKGQTGTVTGQRVSKDSAVIRFVGNLDELNASFGLCVSYLVDSKTEFDEEIGILEDVQKDLFIVGAIAVGAKLEFNSFIEVENIEKTIDDYESLVPKLKNFILPGGAISASQIHYTRTLVRKIEREAVALKSESVDVFLPYLNRLSDLLFAMARYINHKVEEPEVIVTFKK